MMRAIILYLGLFFILLGATSADTGNERFLLPTTKMYLEACREKALSLHPGRIDRVELLKGKHHDSVMRYEISVNHTPAWLLVCDLASGNIFSTQQLLIEPMELKSNLSVNAD